MVIELTFENLGSSTHVELMERSLFFVRNDIENGEAESDYYLSVIDSKRIFFEMWLDQHSKFVNDIVNFESNTERRCAIEDTFFSFLDRALGINMLIGGELEEEEVKIVAKAYANNVDVDDYLTELWRVVMVYATSLRAFKGILKEIGGMSFDDKWISAYNEMYGRLATLKYRDVISESKRKTPTNAEVRLEELIKINSMKRIMYESVGREFKGSNACVEGDPIDYVSELSELTGKPNSLH
jgi:hypothetical protein